jgi:iron complex transport system substrate-binding protein
MESESMSQGSKSDQLIRRNSAATFALPVRNDQNGFADLHGALAMKIVSLLPSATEIVARLGMSDHLVGVSHECFNHQHLPCVTRSRIPTNLSAIETDNLVREFLKQGKPLFELDEELLGALQPDVILTQSLCNVCALDGTQITKAVQSLGPKTSLVEFSPTTLDEVMAGIQSIARSIGANAAGEELLARMRRQVFAVCRTTSLLTMRPTVVFLEWLNPLFSCGHWIPELVELAGGTELIGKRGGRSTTITPQQIIDADPDIIFAACCGWSAQRTRGELATVAQEPWWQQLRAVRADRVYVLDCESSFTMPGPQLAEDCAILAAAINASPTMANDAPRQEYAGAM